MQNSWPIVGRDQELQVLRARLQDAAGGLGSAILVGGEAGVGKSTLLQLIAAEAPGPLAVGYCPGPNETSAFGPWLEAVDLLGREPGVARDELPVPFGRQVGHEPRSAAASLCTWFGARGRPCLVALEDIHWGDAASLELLRHVPHFIRHVPVLLVVTFRNNELYRGHPLWTLLPDMERAGAVKLDLGRLDAEHVEQITRTMIPEHPSRSDLSQRLYTRTEGLPLFIRELLTAVRRKGNLPGEDERLPDTLRQSLDLRLSRLDAGAQRLLEGAALMGGWFPVAPLGRAAGLDEQAVLAFLEEAERLGIVQPSGADAYAFTHALLREALSSGLPGARRRHWHVQIAEALLTSPQPDLELVSLHLSRGNDPRAVDYLLQAGNRALRVGALVQAAEHFRRALEMVSEGDGRRPELLLKLGVAVMRTDPALAEACWQESEQGKSDAESAVWARHFLALRYLADSGAAGLVRLAAVQAEQESLLNNPRYQRLETDLFGEPSPYPRIATHRALLLAQDGQESDARELIAMARDRLGSESARPDLVSVEVALAAPHEAVRLSGRVTELRLQAGDLRGAAAAAYLHLTYLLSGPPDPDAADSAAARLLQIESEAVRRSGMGLLPPGFSTLGHYYYIRGDWDAARHHLLAYFEQFPDDRHLIRRVVAIGLYMDIGDLEGARRALEALPPRSPDGPAAFPRQHFTHWLQAQWSVASGDLPRARLWLQAADRQPVKGNLSQWMNALIPLGWTEYYHALGDPDAARTYAEKAAANAAAATARIDEMRALRWLGRLAGARGERKAALSHLEQALAIATAGRFPYEAALVKLSLAEHLPTDDRAEAWLGEARATLARLGAAPALATADRLLASRATGDRPFGLTLREMEVVGLVARGMTDREIGEHLYISPRTVDSHMRNAFAKTGVNSRAALAAVAARHGLMGSP